MAEATSSFKRGLAERFDIDERIWLRSFISNQAHI